jgi:hypothetical protein
MEKLCKNCKYYTAPENKYKKKDKGTCSCEKFIYDDWSDEIYPLNDKLAYWDYESYYASFYVGSNFGCIHFKHTLV